MAYANNEDLIARYDENTIKELLSDDGTPVETLLTNTKLAAILDAAAGRINAAVTVSNLYTAEDLENLTGYSLELLKDINCDLAMARILRRRPEKWGSESVAEVAREAEEYLDRLRNGDRLFDVASHKDAGLPSVDGPTTADYEQMNLIPDRTKHFYPNRGQRLPIGR